jgi:hypothetical protein
VNTQRDQRLPDFIIIGAMKAGTTSLYQYLAMHPDVVKGKRKEPSFFTQGEFRKGVEWYRNLFPDTPKIKGEASTNYTKYPKFGNVAPRMFSVVPDIKLIYLVRHPVERFVSQIHHMMIKRGQDNSTTKTLEDIRRQQESLRISQYYLQVSQFLDHYPLSRFLFLRFEDLVKDPSGVMNETAGFLGLSPFYTPEINYRVHNKTSTSARVKYKGLHHFLLSAHLRGLIPPVHTKLETPVPKPVLTPDARKFVWDYVAEDLHQFETLIGRQLYYKAPA